MKAEYHKAIEVLKSGGVIVFKTDTVMGMGANGFDKNAVKRLFELKKRDCEKPVSILLPTVQKVFKYALVNERTYKIIKKHFPGAITCVLPAKQCIYTTPVRCGKTVGVRIPKLLPLQEFLAAFQFPLVATSANFSGAEPFSNREGVINAFGNSVYYVDFKYNVMMSGVASTVVDCTNRKIRILRKGSVSL